MDIEQSELLQSAVVLAKDWDWAALTVIAVWMVTCGCPRGDRAWCDERLIFTEAVARDPLAAEDEELRPTPEVDKRDQAILEKSSSSSSSAAWGRGVPNLLDFHSVPTQRAR